MISKDPPQLPVTTPAPRVTAAHTDRILLRKVDGELPGVLKATAFIAGVIGALVGLVLLAELPTPALGICFGLSSLCLAIAAYALSDIVRSLRRIAFNTARPTNK